MKVFLIARKSLVEVGREVQLLALTIALPLVFLAITWATYNAQLLRTHKIWVTRDSNMSQAMVTTLEAERYADGSQVFDIVAELDFSSAEEAIEQGQATVLVQFNESIEEGKTKVTIYGDALSNSFYRASTLLENAIRRAVLTGSGKSPPVVVVESPLSSDGPRSEFDLYAPGMITFGLLMIIPQTAMMISREVRWKTLSRLQLSTINSWDLFAGISLAQMVIAIVQVLIVLLAALIMGFNNQGSIALAVVVGLALSASAIGQGLFVACFTEDDSVGGGQIAVRDGNVLAMIQVFLSGSFYQLPPLTIFTLAGHQIDLFDIFPATHCFRALQQVLSYGDGLLEISFRLGATLVLSLFYFVVGVILFRRLKMGAN